MNALNAGAETDWVLYFRDGPQQGERISVRGRYPPTGYLFRDAQAFDLAWVLSREPHKPPRTHHYRYASRVTYDGELVYIYDGVW